MLLVQVCLIISSTLTILKQVLLAAVEVILWPWIDTVKEVPAVAACAAPAPSCIEAFAVTRLSVTSQLCQIMSLGGPSLLPDHVTPWMRSLPLQILANCLIHGKVRKYYCFWRESMLAQSPSVNCGLPGTGNSCFTLYMNLKAFEEGAEV